MLYFLGAGVLLTLNRYLNIGEKKVFRNQSNIYDGVFGK